MKTNYLKIIYVILVLSMGMIILLWTTKNSGDSIINITNPIVDNLDTQISDKLPQRSTINVNLPTMKPGESTLSIIARITIKPFKYNTQVKLSLINTDNNVLYQRSILCATIVVNTTIELNDSMAGLFLIAEASGYVTTKVPVISSKVSVDINDKYIIYSKVASDNLDFLPGSTIKILSTKNRIYMRESITDEMGDCEMQLSHGGEYVITASHPRFSKSKEEKINLEKNPNFVSFTLDDNIGTIYGKVKNNFEVPIQNCNIVLYDKDKLTVVKQISTNETGQYVIDHIATGKYFIGPDGDGYIKRNIIIADSVEKYDDLLRQVRLTSEDNSKEENFLIQEVKLIHGKVVDENKREIPDALVLIAYKGAKYSETLLPLMNKVYTDSNGNFCFSIDIKCDFFSEIQVSAIHKSYEYGFMTIPIDWNKECEPVSIVLHEPNSQFKSVIIDYKTNFTIENKEIILTQYPFRNDDRFKIRLRSNEQGLVETKLPESEYQIDSNEMEIISPKQIIIKGTGENFINIYVNNEVKDKTFIKGIVTTKSGIPINGVKINLLFTNNKISSSGVGTVSLPDGSFSLNVLNEEINELMAINFSYEGYLPLKFMLDDTTNLSSIKVKLDGYKGAIKSFIINYNKNLQYTIQLFSAKDLNTEIIANSVINPVYVFNNIDPNKGPFFLVAKSENIFGISKILDLDKTPSKYLEANLFMNEITEKTNFIINIKDSKSGLPVPFVTCKFQSVLYNNATGHELLTKTLLSNNYGKVILENIGCFAGMLTLSNGYYEDLTVPISFDAKTDNNSIDIVIERVSLK